jgi:hypothetical protein
LKIDWYSFSLFIQCRNIWYIASSTSIHDDLKALCIYIWIINYIITNNIYCYSNFSLSFFIIFIEFSFPNIFIHFLFSLYLLCVSISFISISLLCLYLFCVSISFVSLFLLCLYLFCVSISFVSLSLYPFISSFLLIFLMFQFFIFIIDFLALMIILISKIFAHNSFLEQYN